MLKSREYEDEEVIFEDDIEVYEPRMFKSKTFIGKGKVSLYNNSFKFKFDCVWLLNRLIIFLPVCY